MGIPTLREKSLDDQATDFLRERGYHERLTSTPGDLAGSASDVDVLLNSEDRGRARALARRLGVRLHR